MQAIRGLLVGVVVLSACTETKTVYVDRFVDRGIVEFDSTMGMLEGDDADAPVDRSVPPTDMALFDAMTSVPDAQPQTCDGLAADAGIVECDPPLALNAEQTAARPYDPIRLG